MNRSDDGSVTYTERFFSRTVVVVLIIAVALGYWAFRERGGARDAREDLARMNTSLGQQMEQQQEQIAELKAENSALEHEIKDVTRTVTRREYHEGALHVCEGIYSSFATIVSTEDGSTMSFNECKFYFVPTA